MKLVNKNKGDKTDQSFIIAVKAMPGASQNKIMGKYNEAIKIAVHAQPEKGKANEALIKFLAKTLGISKQNIKIISGETSQLKKIQITGMTEECFQQLINI